jgi:hypothetical protein
MLEQRVENEIFTAIKTAVEGKCPNAYVVGEYQRSVPKFPCVSFMEVNQVPAANRETAANIETMVFVQYEINVYTNDAIGKKSNANEMAGIVDGVMQGNYKLRRVLKQPIPNLEDATIYRLVMRYEGYIDCDTNIIYTGPGW